MSELQIFFPSFFKRGTSLGKVKASSIFSSFELEPFAYSSQIRHPIKYVWSLAYFRLLSSWALWYCTWKNGPTSPYQIVGRLWMVWMRIGPRDKPGPLSPSLGPFQVCSMLSFLAQPWERKQANFSLPNSWQALSSDPNYFDPNLKPGPSSPSLCSFQL